ncbi:Anti-sigma regulatory factor (Ser/Thr protein kinase) [Lentzea xinjiangensis]|uniref:Anti-sigma regulatory factor (Ser/Thr protein kinase) n=1 Tax=Lentzea xinjiangensis TaxID=402600 RepID=A0A1H9JW61_9PSEU|nr:ATP-binding SpoIIE family protein phosphatase [Lentzea xinjiangensis]SEQ91004.1 Anti-sigma regulatory factor (Ser/Thr protein kinase) [Lentzea xinjiangensis]
MEEVTTAACLPLVRDEAWLPVEETAQVGRVRRTATALAERLGFTATRAAEIGLAATEIGTNLHKHARQGVVLIRSVRGVQDAAVEVLAIDRGPGIADVALAWEDGQSTAGTLGVGLGAVARLATSCSMTSRPGSGTALVARFAPRPQWVPEWGEESAAGLTRPITGEEMCGDAYAVCRGADRLTLMMCDGSGHGPLAAAASDAAVRLFRDLPPMPPEQLVTRLHAALRGTRGGAVAVADIDLAARKVRYCGLGNIGAAVLAGDHKQGMISVPGVAGHQARTIRAFDYPLPDRALVVMHSDGLTERWGPDVVVDPLADAPVLVAATLLREAGVRNDDACVLAARPS